ncbi:membrane-associated calcum-binding protein, related, putative [Eimeria necatrix]|uniref:Membrane-associated calcum-binding protein, related, putative n=2 Tax=Eimeria TaxID=5800 RepID=U6MJE6_9EIME|nr:membrane-associated calcum-binding protein, related, putative [Eimeria tenella]XP_013440560.1 membrane-associated calcum-binding protein, related, putative [Eimeria necatrix]UIE77776.1 membrane-associated EF-hand calcium-binding protein [Eimeria tenella]CDJ38212.1 membrane-associated calcum-binding protein, related, putative [Eimeria tenella]CDJ63198.1 membrane-associated calcum-binding protein, related, putative [Eimeria necatrix]|eukprot:XP_013229050.1 membrane-associated calcum-binding protein, related, putative [Eimeria tenella]
MKVTAASLAATATAVAFATSAAVGSPEPPPKLSGEKLAELMQLSLSEIKDRMETIFSFIDTNGDGVITTEEAQQWSTRLKDAMHKHQVRQEFISIDKDGDGKITLEELEVTYTDGADAANQEAHKEEVQKRFAAVDKDKSGSLSLEEVTVLMDPGKDATLMQIEVDEIMAAQDKDKDGNISLDEFLLNEGGTLTDPEREELTREFSTYDKNGDGKIDEAELRAVIEDPHAHDLQQMMESLAAEMEDGKITKDQWTDKFETFSVSMLTDNGELLRFPEEYEGVDLPFKGISVGPGDEDAVSHDEL